VEIESTAVEVDGCFEVLAVATASKSLFDRHDLAVEALGFCIRHTVEAVSDRIGQGCILVHLGLLWVEIESTAVEVDGCFEVLAVAIASKIAV
jgi:hypothetical protein